MQVGFPLLAFLAAVLFFTIGPVAAMAAEAPTIEWQRLLGGSGPEYAYSGQQTADGGYVLLGYSQSSASGDVPGTNHGLFDFWVVKLDGDGEIKWQRLLGGSRDDRGRSVQQTADGGYILVGYSNSSASGDVTGTNHGGYDIWVVKLDGDGETQWQKLLGGSGYEWGESVQQTTDGGYVFLGTSNSSASGDVTGTNHGGDDFWVVKLADNGEIQWQRLLGGSENQIIYYSGHEQGLAIQQTADGGYILGGRSTSSESGDVADKNNGDWYTATYDIWVVKLDREGDIQWQNLLGGEWDEYITSIQQTPDGNYILLGDSQSSWSGDVLDKNAGIYDLWLVTLNTKGYVMNQRLLGGSGYEICGDVRRTADGGYILLGSSSSSESEDVTGTNHGGDDRWVVKLSKSGNIQWQRLLGGSGDDAGSSVQQTTDGGYILFGRSESSISGDVTHANHGSSDVWVVKLVATPVAGFIMTPSSGPVPLTVSFTDSSLFATSWEYDFGDGTGLSAAQNPSHVFYGGQYEVIQTVKNGGGEESLAQQIVSAWSPVPGRIEAEDFDGDVDGWYDTTAGNSGGAYRQTGVDIEAGGSNYNVGWVAEGEYLRYTVDVDADRDYTFTFRTGTWEPGRTIDIYIGSDLRATVTTPQTGSSSVFADVSTVIPLSTADHEVKIVFHGSSQNLDYFTVTPLGVIVTPTPLPVQTVPNGGAGVPTDKDGDGLYEDVNGNGRKDFADVVLYFNEMSWIAANEPVPAFDYNKNQRIDFADVVWLFNAL